MNDAEQRMAEHFYGYGEWSAPYWFIGPEPGQGKSESDDLTSRVKAWRLEESPELADLCRYHDRLSAGMWTREGTAMQQTWRKLMLVLHSYKRESVAKETLRTYQRTRLGRAGEETCLIELGGLAARSNNTHRDRVSYREARFHRIKRQMSIHKPQFAVMYGKRQHLEFEVVAGRALAIDEIVWSGPTAIVLTKHPNARKLTDQHWCTLGHSLHKAITEHRQFPENRQ